MKAIRSLIVVLLGAAALGVMMNTVPNYNSSFQPRWVSVDRGEVGEAQFFQAELLGLQTADVISYTQFGQDVSRDTSATFLVAELSVTGRTESRQLEAIWLGATGREYHLSGRLQDAPHSLTTARFEPDLTDRAFAIFELPPDEIVGGSLGLSPRRSRVGDTVVKFPGPEAMPEKQTVLRLTQ